MHINSTIQAHSNEKGGNYNFHVTISTSYKQFFIENPLVLFKTNILDGPFKFFQAKKSRYHHKSHKQHFRHCKQIYLPFIFFQGR